MTTSSTSTIRRRAARAAVTAPLVAVVVLPGGPAAAASGPAVCVSKVTVGLTPGLTFESTDFHYSSGGPTGTVFCVGSINGHEITGPGTVEDIGAGTGGCNGGSISGANIYTLPTTGGTVTVRQPVEAQYAGPTGMRVKGTNTYPGGFGFAPTKGDCVAAPLTEVEVVIYGVMLG